MKSLADYGWQDRFIKQCIAHFDTNRVFTLAACPGSGKTKGSLRAGKRLIETKAIRRIIICAHSDEICRQWRGAATKLGLNIYVGWRQSHGDQADYHGIAVTYQSLAFNGQQYRQRCSREPTLLILDEAHHIGTDLAWDASLDLAFEPVKKILVLSGTPFRHDGRLPKFIEHTYDANTKQYLYKTHLSFSYSEAIQAHICREIYFPHFDGEVRWISRSGQEQLALISTEKLPQSKQRERNRAALHPEGDWVRTVFYEAHQKLMECRQIGHRNAGGLILASDQYEARRFRDALQEVTSQEAVVVTSSEPNVEDLIEKYRHSDDCWIIAVRMINEGVDIPRLRVLVYATNCETETHFLQAMGRIARAGDDDDDYIAYAFLPHRQPFLDYAENMRKERDKGVRLRDGDDVPPATPGRNGGDGDPTPNLYMPLKSSAIAMGTLAHDMDLTPEELAYARQEKQRANLPGAVEVIARAFRHAKFGPVAPAEATAPALPKKDAQIINQELRTEIRKLIGKLVQLKPDRDYNWYHVEWMRRGGKPQAEETNEGLERKYQWLLIFWRKLNPDAEGESVGA